MATCASVLAACLSPEQDTDKNAAASMMIVLVVAISVLFYEISELDAEPGDAPDIPGCGAETGLPVKRIIAVRKVQPVPAETDSPLDIPSFMEHIGITV